MTRNESFGQGYDPTLVDRFGVWLSSRQLRRYLGDLRGKHIGDFGCGYHASFVRSILTQIDKAILLDVSIADDLKQHPKIHTVEGDLITSLRSLPSDALDVVLCISVLEHLWEPKSALCEMHRVLKLNGVCLLNVPSWRGKTFLELSAFRLGLSPAAEMNDHKMYYDRRDLWPLLVAAGFLPEHIRCFSHKFGLNTFASCVKKRSGRT